MADESGGRLAAALSVRPGEVAIVRPLSLAAAMLGFALVFFFSASNALFLVDFGADDLPWVYIVNAPLVIAAGLLYSAVSRRLPVAAVLNGSTIAIAVSVAALWVWSALSSGTAASFAMATWFRFLFVFSLLGLWEVASAQFDVRQAKRLFPVVAVGMMAAFMVGGAIVSPLTAIVGTRNLIAVSAAFFVVYAFVFARVVGRCDFSESDDAVPASPREILSDRFSRNLAIMRYIVILLVFVTEFIFYEQVAATFDTDDSIARFLGFFLAASTLIMVIITALLAGRYIARFGIRIGLMTMPIGLMICAIAIGVYGTVRGVDTVFFCLVVFANFANVVLANAIETPVGAVLFQPMPVERRMPVRVAVDGWLGSAAVLLTGVLLLGFRAFNFASIVPFAWLLAVIGALGAWVAVLLYRDYRHALEEATTLAFGGSGGAFELGADLDERREVLHARLTGDDPAAILAVAGLVNELEDNPLGLVLPSLIDSPDPEVAVLAVQAMAKAPLGGSASQLASVTNDPQRPIAVRSAALAGLATAAPSTIVRTAFDFARRRELDELTQTALRLDATGPDPQPSWNRVQSLLDSADHHEREFAAGAIPAAAVVSELDPQIETGLLALVTDADPVLVSAGLRAMHGRVQPQHVGVLVELGRRPEHRPQVVRALAATTATNMPSELDAFVGDLSDRYVVDLIDDVYARQTRRPILLHRFIAPDSRSAIRRAGFDALRRADVNPPATVARMVRDDVEFLRLVVAMARDVAEDAPVLLDDALAAEFAAARAAIYAAIRIPGHSARIREVEQLIADGGDDESRANGIEALDTLLDTDVRLMVIPALEPVDIHEAKLTMPQLPGIATTREWLQRIVDAPRFGEPTRRLAHHHLCADTPDAKAEKETLAMSEIIERIVALKRIDIFSSLPYELLNELATVVESVQVASDDAIIEAGEFGDELYAITSGDVQVQAGESAVTTLQAGDVFGELAVLAPAPRSATVTARSDCELLVLSRTMLLALTARRPEVMAEIAKVLAVRLRETNPG